MATAVARTGFAFLPSGGPTLADPAVRRSLAPVDRLEEERVLREAFAGRTAAVRAGRLLDVLAHWPPDVVVRDEVDLGAAVAAERAGVPHAAVVVLAAGGLLRPDVIGGPLDALRARHGLPPDRHLEQLHGGLVLAPVPPGFRAPEHPLPRAARSVRPAVLEPPGPGEELSAGLRSWLAAGSGPVVLVTLGTVFPQESGDLLRRVVDALAPMDVRTVVTVGDAVGPDELGPVPEHVRLERFVPQAALLPQCDLVVCHAGSGSVVGALALGVPLVLLPLGADQPWNADRCAALGTGRVLDAVSATSDDVRAAVVDVLREPGYRAAAQRLSRACAGLRTADDAVDLLEAHAAGHRSALG